MEYQKRSYHELPMTVEHELIFGLQGQPQNLEMTTPSWTTVQLLRTYTLIPDGSVSAREWACH